MKILEIVVLGIIQGIAEFLPISSSAHLIIFRDIFNIGSSITSDMELSFDVALHLGTLLAILIFFFKDFLKIVIDGITFKGKLLWYLVIATIPAAIFGFLFEDVIDNALRNSYISIAFALALMGVIIYIVDKNADATKDVEKLSLMDSIAIGLAQVFALLPGVSRSGATITAGRVCKLKREDAAKFSFFLSVPIVAGAVLVKLIKGSTITMVATHVDVFLVGIIVSFLTGLLSIKFLLKYLKNHDFKLFMWYRIILALIVIAKILL